MPRNVYFSHGTSSEQNLYEDIIIESLRIYGHEAYYIPRKLFRSRCMSIVLMALKVMAIY